jgi:hypothetical protein
MLAADSMSGIRVRLPFRTSGRQRPGRRYASYRPDLATEVSRLEDRCLMATFQFKGYDWSNDYRHNLEGKGWYSSGQQWAPRNAFGNASGLHLQLKTATIKTPDKDYTDMSSAELDLVGKDGRPFHPGYGTYLVAAQTPGGFNNLANNQTVVFGAFTYQKNADPSQINTYHELDMVEASRFGTSPNGWIGDPTNAQFAIQPYTHSPGINSLYNNVNVHRITLDNSNDIALAMVWKGANQPVTFYAYYGIKDLDQLKTATPAVAWTTTASQNPLIPNSGQQTIHLNLWRQPQSPDLPKNFQAEVTIKNFQYNTATNIIPVP